MPFDADALWWPPAARLHATLASSAAAAASSAASSSPSSSSKNGNVVDGDAVASSSPSSAVAAASAVVVQRIQATLKEYERWLVAGLHTFKRRSSDSNSPSRAALLSGSPLTLTKGAKKIPVDGRLVQAALELAVVAVSERVSSGDS